MGHKNIRKTMKFDEVKPGNIVEFETGFGTMVVLKLDRASKFNGINVNTWMPVDVWDKQEVMEKFAHLRYVG
jgi:hypothetical protein